MEDLSFHEPVLLKEVLDALVPSDGINRDAWILDATLGDGGHTIDLLRAGMKVKGIDQDPQALKRAQTRLVSLEFDESCYILEKRNFADLSDLGSFKGILFDLGVSTLQLQDPTRGFSIKRDGPLDMRMDPSLSVSAKELINGLNKGELNELFSKGGEKLAKPIAAAVVLAREVSPITKTSELANIVEKVYRRIGKISKIHPATKVFQALRIVVNDELNNLKEVLPQALEHLEPKGRIVVLSFHSIEDKIIKEKFTGWQKNGFGRVITKKPVFPTAEEISENPYARSAKMRVFEKA